MKNILCMIALAGALAAQAQRDNPLANHIPADADKVFQVNLGSISSKIDWLSIASLMKDHNLGSHTPMKMDDMMSLMNSGIDFHGGVIVATSDIIPDSATYTTILVNLTDSGTFAAFIRTRGHNIHMLHLAGKERVAVEKEKAAAWTDHLAVIVIAKSLKHAASKTATTMLQIEGRIGHRTVAALHGFTNTYFVTDPRFTTAFADDGDLHMWSRHSTGVAGLSKLLGSKGNAQMNAFAQLASKSGQDATIGTVRFDAGKLTYHHLKLLTPEEKTAQERISSSSFSSDLIAAIPPGELMGLLTVHYNMSAWIDSMSRHPFAPMFTGKLKDKGITLDDFSHALKGSFLVLAYAPENTDTGKMPVIYLAATIDDKATFDRLAAAIKLTDAASAPAPAESTAGADTAGDTTAHHKKSPFRYYTTRNGVAVIGATREQVNDFFNHSPGAANPNAATPASRLLTDKVNSSTFTLSIDIHSFADFLTPMLTKADTISAKNQMLLNSLRKMDVLHWSSGAINGDAQESTFELRFTDPNKNALASLMDILSTMSRKKDSE